VHPGGSGAGQPPPTGIHHLDDVQWAELATLMALGSLPVQRFLIPGRLDPGSAAAAASAHLQSLTACTRARARQHVGPLDAVGAASLAADMLGTPPDASAAGRSHLRTASEVMAELGRRRSLPRRQLSRQPTGRKTTAR
jgi:hypothetical protein